MTTESTATTKAQGWRKTGQTEELMQDDRNYQSLHVRYLVLML